MPRRHQARALRSRGPFLWLTRCAQVSLRLGWGRRAAASRGTLTPLFPTPSGYMSSESREGYLHVAHFFLPSFLHVEKAYTSLGLLISFSGARAPKVPSVPGTCSLSLPPLYRWPLLLSVERRRSFPGLKRGQAAPGSSLKGWGARCADWSYLERNRVKSECFREKKRAVRPAGREPCRTWVLGKSALWDIGGHLLSSKLEKATVVWVKAALLATPSSGSKCLWACSRSSVSCSGVCVCVFFQCMYM